MITIIADGQAFSFGHEAWARDSDGDVHVYDDSGPGDDNTVATFDADSFTAIFQNLPDEKQEYLADAIND
jgi:hypothetical protein